MLIPFNYCSICRLNKFSWLIFISIIYGGCDSSSDVQSGETGDWNVVVNIKTVDEFYRPVLSEEPTNVVLTSTDRIHYQLISKGDSIASFTNVPYQEYIATVSRPGYYPSSRSTHLNNNYKTISIQVPVYPIPSLLTRIDSFKCYPNTVSPQIRVKMFTAQTVPHNGKRQVVLFAGSQPNVSSEFGTYEYFINGITQLPGNSEIITDDFYRDIHASGFASGSRVYITARIKTGATLEYGDAATGLTIFENLDGNTKAVASFIMP